MLLLGSLYQLFFSTVKLSVCLSLCVHACGQCFNINFQSDLIKRVFLSVVQGVTGVLVPVNF